MVNTDSLTMQNNGDWNVFIGTKTGIFKGLHVSEKGVKKIKNLIKVEDVDNKKEITCLNWADKEETEILIGYSNQVVKIYDTQLKCFSFRKKLKCGEGYLKGLSKYCGRLVTATESGEIRQWDIDTKIKTEDKINCGPCLERMCQNMDNVNCIATGGKENELKLWDLEKCVNTFTAKNVRPDELELRVPVWVSDITFIPLSSKVAISSRHGFVRLYDPNSSFRRPVSQVHIRDQALTCISTTSREGHVLVGSGTGHMFLVDLRNKGIVLNHYKGFVGGIKQIACSNNEPYVVSVGLDRHVRLHNLNTKELLLKEYLQSRLTRVLLRSDFTMIEKDSSENEESEEEFEIKEEKLEIKSEDSRVNESDNEGKELVDKTKSLGKRKMKKLHAKKNIHVKKKPQKKYVIL